jgi:hypothetical protein
MAYKDPEKERATKREYYLRNRERVLEYQRQYELSNRERDRERRREYKRQWNAENRDKNRGYRRKYRESNRDKLRELEQQWRAANPDRARQSARKYRAINGEKLRVERLQYAHGPDFDVTWAAMWEAQQGRCYLCERPMDPAEAVMEHWHGCAAHEPKRSCRRCQRGLAHPKCNQAIGFAGDDPAILRTIADNLERANADIAARQAVIPQHITLF